MRNFLFTNILHIHPIGVIVILWSYIMAGLLLYRLWDSRSCSLSNWTYADKPTWRCVL